MLLETFTYPFNKTLLSAVEHMEKIESLKNDKLYVEIWYCLETGDVFTRTNEDKTHSALHCPSHNPTTLFIGTTTKAINPQYLVNMIIAKLAQITLHLPQNPSSCQVEIKY